MNCLSACIVVAATLLGIAGVEAMESGQTPDSGHEQPSAPQLPPAMKLVGTFSAGGNRGSAILSIDGEQRVLLLQDLIGNGWWLEAIDSGHVLMTDGARVMRLDLQRDRPYPVSAEGEPGGEIRALPLEVHTSETHVDLEPGQSRRFFAPSESVAGDPGESPLARWERLQLELNDPGMSRRFGDAPAPEAVDPDEIPDSPVSTELEPGQSIRFGPEPPPDEIDPDEVPD